jgi:hypothetical protein
MFMNPIHPGFASFIVGESEQKDDFQEPTEDSTLDSELYVQPPHTTHNDGVLLVQGASQCWYKPGDVFFVSGTHA